MTLSPHAAMGISLFVPGAAHVALGRAARGAIAFVLTVGMFVCGYRLVGERLWAMELFKPFAVLKPVFDLIPWNTLPDGLNTGCLFIASLLRSPLDPNLERLMRDPRDYEHIGLCLTGLSGIASCLWAADAFALASQRRFPGVLPGTAAFATWLLPGSGHWLVGQRDKGMLMGGAVIVMWCLGLWFGHGHSVDRPDWSAWWIGQSPFGGGCLLASITTGPLRRDGIPPFLDLGVCLGTVAGLMNVVLIVDAYSIAEGRPAQDATDEASSGAAP